MSEKASESEGHRTGSSHGNETVPDACRKQLMDLRVQVLERQYKDETKVSGLLYDADLNPNDYSLDGSASTIWANLIPALEGRGELSAVLRVLVDRVGAGFAQTVRELSDYYAKQERKAADDRAYPLMRNRLHEDIEAALKLLQQAHGHSTTLLMPYHPTAARMAGMRAWITGCVKAIAKAQKSGAKVAYEDEAAQVENVATQLAAVSDAFRSYASLLERSRITGEGGPGNSQRSLTDVDEDETLLLSKRQILRSSIQQLIMALQNDNLPAAERQDG